MMTNGKPSTANTDTAATPNSNQQPDGDTHAKIQAQRDLITTLTNENFGKIWKRLHGIETQIANINLQIETIEERLTNVAPQTSVPNEPQSPPTPSGSPQPRRSNGIRFHPDTDNAKPRKTSEGVVANGDVDGNANPDSDIGVVGTPVCSML